MSTLAVAAAIDPVTLLGATTDIAAPSWSGRAWRGEGVSCAASGGSVSTVGRWLVIGRPTPDPWGRPASADHAPALVASLERFGPPAVQLWSGPWAAIRLSDPIAVRAPNGAVPLHFAPGPGWWASTDPRITGRDDAGGRAVPAGAAIDVISGVTLFDGTPVGATSVRGATRAGFAAELCERAPWRGAALALSTVDDPGAGTVRAGDHDSAVLDSDAAARRDVSFFDRYGGMRETGLAKLWWAVRLQGRWLHAPAFERVAGDLAVLVDAPLA